MDKPKAALPSGRFVDIAPAATVSATFGWSPTTATAISPDFRPAWSILSLVGIRRAR